MNGRFRSYNRFLGLGKDVDSYSVMDGPEEGRQTVHLTNLENGGTSPTYDLICAVSAIKGDEPTNLSPLYDQVDNLVDQFFASHRSASAQAQIEFTWEEVRVNIYQDGSAVLQEAN